MKTQAELIAELRAHAAGAEIVVTPEHSRAVLSVLDSCRQSHTEIQQAFVDAAMELPSEYAAGLGESR